MNSKKRTVPTALGVIDIQQPAPPSPYPANHSIGAYCMIDANGSITDPDCSRIRDVWGWVNEVGHRTAGAASQPRDWSVTCPFAFNGTLNTFYVEIIYEIGGTPEPAVIEDRVFIGMGGGSGCDPTFGCVPETRQVLAEMASDVMPRFYRIGIDEPRSAETPVKGMLLGGLLQSQSVHVAYDAQQSTPAAPVWRDINLPSQAGHWNLRVWRHPSGYSATLVLQRLSNTEVLPPVVFTTSNWRFFERNALHNASVEPHELLRTVTVEPA